MFVDTTKNPDAARSSSRLFFFAMSLALTGVALLGFGLSAARMPGSLADLPAAVRLHAALCGIWLVLLVVQGASVLTGRLQWHRALGWTGALLAILVLTTGVAVTIACVRRGAVPPFFPPNLFLVTSLLAISGFAGLTAGAIVLRRRPLWHRRLMLGGTLFLIGPAVARLLPMPVLGPQGGIAVTGALLSFVLLGAAHDALTRRAIHPGWLTVGLAIVAAQGLAGPIAFSPPVIALTGRLLGVHG